MPAVCSREPPNYNTINAGSIEGEAAVHIRYEYRRTLKVDYIAAFFHHQFVYFISVEHQENKRIVQKLLPQKTETSKLIRICKNDTRYEFSFLAYYIFLMEMFEAFWIQKNRDTVGA